MPVLVSETPVKYKLGVMKKSTLLLLVLSAAPSIAHAEVSDKMPTIAHILVQAVNVASVAFFLSWFRWWFVFLGLAACLFFIAGTISLWQEIPMREALLEEQGAKYFWAWVVADATVLAGSVFGVSLSWRKRNAAQPIIPPDAT